MFPAARNLAAKLRASPGEERDIKKTRNPAITTNSSINEGRGAGRQREREREKRARSNKSFELSSKLGARKVVDPPRISRVELADGTPAGPRGGDGQRKKNG